MVTDPRRESPMIESLNSIVDFIGRLDISDETRRRNRVIFCRTLKIFTVLFVIAWICFVYEFYRAMRVKSYVMQQNIVIGQTIHYLERTEGAWPSSWDDLFLDREDREWLSENIFIDFQADPATLAKQSPEEFEAIHLKTPGMERTNYREDQLLETLRKYHPAE